MVRLVRQAVAADLPLNRPLPHDLYDEDGRLLLKSGFVIAMPGFAERLLLRGCFIGDPTATLPAAAASAAAPGAGASSQHDATRPPPAKVPVFLRASDLVTSVRRIHRLLAEPANERFDLGGMVRERAALLQELLAEDCSAVLAAPCLTLDANDPRPSQQLLGAAIIALLAPLCDFAPEESRSMICAALTRDAALSEFERSYAGKQALTNEARQRIEAHPQEGVAMLQKHGITERRWLRCVLEHHERPDGSGYPRRLGAAAIDPGALLLALADSYAAMVLANPRRSGIFPANSLKELFLAKGSRYLEKHVAMLVKTFGRFPPGTLVSLASNEIGVVRTLEPNNPHPPVQVVYDKSGMPCSTPLERDTAQPGYAISGCVSLERCRSALLVIRRLWL